MAEHMLISGAACVITVFCVGRGAPEVRLACKEERSKRSPKIPVNKQCELSPLTNTNDKSYSLTKTKQQTRAPQKTSIKTSTTKTPCQTRYRKRNIWSDPSRQINTKKTLIRTIPQDNPQTQVQALWQNTINNQRFKPESQHETRRNLRLQPSQNRVQVSI